MRRYVVQGSDPTSVVAVLSVLGETPSAIDEGRVFVGRERVRDAARVVSPGEEVFVHQLALRPSTVEVLSEWNSLFAVMKPSGLPTEPDRKGAASVVTALASLLRVPPSALHAATRLDLPVSGVVIVAQGAEAMRRVAALQDQGSLKRRYLAFASGSVEPTEGEWDSPIGRDARGRPTAGGRDARPAVTKYRVAASANESCLLVLEPKTGRSHQLRIHAAQAGAPLLGDALRGGPSRVVRADGLVCAVPRVALHAGRVSVVTDDRAEWSVTARVPSDLATLWQELGGNTAALEIPEVG